jgi:hypothetical protein
VFLLRTSYFYCRILLFRPLLIASTRQSTATNIDSFAPIFESPSHSRIVTQVCNLCVEACHDLVANLYLDITIHDRWQIHPWYYIYCKSFSLHTASPHLRIYQLITSTSIADVFNAALILVAAQLCQCLNADLDEARLATTWSHCIFILSCQHKQIPASNAIIVLLETLKMRTTQSRPQPSRTSSGTSMDLITLPSSVIPSTTTCSSSFVAEDIPIHVSSQPMGVETEEHGTSFGSIWSREP